MRGAILDKKPISDRYLTNLCHVLNLEPEANMENAIYTRMRARLIQELLLCEVCAQGWLASPNRWIPAN